MYIATVLGFRKLIVCVHRPSLHMLPPSRLRLGLDIIEICEKHQMAVKNSLFLCWFMANGVRFSYRSNFLFGMSG
jgi:hypothetical protein